MRPNEKYFKLFGLEPGASKDEIRKAYRKLVMKYHPDRNPSPEAEQKFLVIKDAYDILLGKKEAPGLQNNTVTKANQRKETQEQRVKDAQRRFEEQQLREFLENELYFRKLTSGLRWKIMKYLAIAGIFLTFLLILDRFLPHHYQEDKVIAYSANRANSEDGERISLVETENGYRFWISRLRYSLVSRSPDVYIERSWIFHNPIRLVSIEKLGYNFYPIHFRFYRHTWLLIILFLLPSFTLWYKRRTIAFTVLYNFVFFGVGALMVVYFITGDRWAHVLTFGFY